MLSKVCTACDQMMPIKMENIPQKWHKHLMNEITFSNFSLILLCVGVRFAGLTFSSAFIVILLTVLYYIVCENEWFFRVFISYRLLPIAHECTYGHWSFVTISQSDICFDFLKLTHFFHASARSMLRSLTIHR